MSQVTIGQVAKAIGAPDAAKDWAEHVEQWDGLYRCQRPEIILYDQLGREVRKRYRRSLGMPKRICEDWAGLLWSEHAGLECEDEATAEFLIGMFSGPAFISRYLQHLERTFAYGTGAVELLIEDMTVSPAGAVDMIGSRLVPTFATARSILPLSWAHDAIDEVAFVSYLDTKRVVVREHRKRPGGGYVLTNRAYKLVAANLTPDELPAGLAESVDLPGAPPLFVIDRPAIVNNVDPASPYGVSIFANAIDHLDALDVAFDNFAEDFALGGKMVFVPDTMIRKDSAGNEIPPQREKRNLFAIVEDPAGGTDGAKITEYNPDLRVTDNITAIDAALSLVSNAVGMGAERYRYRSETIATATQIVSENAELFRNRSRHLMLTAANLEHIARSALWCASTLLGVGVDPYAEITVRSDDSVIEDDGARIKRGLEYLGAGGISQRTFLVDYYGMTEDEADAEVARSAVRVGVEF